MKVLIFSVLITFIDQATKISLKGLSVPFLNFEHQGMFQGQKIPFLYGLLNLYVVENQGIAFGIYFGSGFQPFISILTLITAAGLIVYLFRIRNKPLLMRLSLAFIIGGAAGNLLDRLFYGVIYGYAPVLQGSVVDFININFSSLQLLDKILGAYVFNIADAAITLGTLFFILCYRKLNSSGARQPQIPENILAESRE